MSLVTGELLSKSVGGANDNPGGALGTAEDLS